MVILLQKLLSWSSSLLIHERLLGVSGFVAGLVGMGGGEGELVHLNLIWHIWYVLLWNWKFYEAILRKRVNWYPLMIRAVRLGYIYALYVYRKIIASTITALCTVVNYWYLYLLTTWILARCDSWRVMDWFEYSCRKEEVTTTNLWNI